MNHLITVGWPPLVPEEEARRAEHVATRPQPPAPPASPLPPAPPGPHGDEPALFRSWSRQR
jgi:hypothetical protein